MAEIKHVLLDYSGHFLVVDGTRGPLQTHNDRPAIHPSGYIKYREDSSGYDFPEFLKGKLFKFDNQTVTIEEIDQCEPAQSKWREYVELTNECQAVHLRRFDEAQPKQGE